MISALKSPTSIHHERNLDGIQKMKLQQATLPVPQFDQITLADLKQKIEASRSLGAYVEQFTCKPISEYGEGIPIAFFPKHISC